MNWIKQLFCRHEPRWGLRPPKTRLYGDPNYEGWVCKKCGKEVWKGRGYINFTATQLKRDHEIWMSKPVPDYVPDCADPVWHGMFENLWKSNIEYAANAALKRKVCKHPLGGTAWGATIPIHKEKKMEFKIGDKVRHECGVEGIVEGVGTPSLLVRVTTKNVFHSGEIHEWAESLVTKLPEPAPAPHPNVGDRMQFRGEIVSRPDSPTRDVCWTVKLDGSNGEHTRISQSEMRDATRVEPQMHQAACEAYNDLLKSQNNHLIAENEKVKREFSFNVENHTNARKEIDKLRAELKLANQKLEEATCCVAPMTTDHGFNILAECSKDMLDMWMKVNGQKDRIVGAFPVGLFGVDDPRRVPWEKIVEQVKLLLSRGFVGYFDPTGASPHDLHRKLAEKEKLIDEMIESMRKLERQVTDLERQSRTQRASYAATKKTLYGEREKSAQLEKQVKNLKATIEFGEKWETELRVALGIAGPHSKGVKILDAVKSLKEAKAWQHYEPEIRAKERERIFRKLTGVCIGGIQRGFTMHQGVLIHELEFTEQALSDFLKED